MQKSVVSFSKVRFVMGCTYIGVAILLLIASADIGYGQVLPNAEQAQVYTALVDHIEDELTQADVQSVERWPDYRPLERTYLLRQEQLPFLTNHVAASVVERLQNRGIRARPCAAPCRTTRGEISIKVVEHKSARNQVYLKVIQSGTTRSGKIWETRTAYELERGSAGWEIVSERLEWEGLYMPAAVADTFGT